MAHIGLDARLTHYRIGGISRYITALVSAFETLPLAHNLTLLQSRKSKDRLSWKFPTRKTWTPPHHPLERAALSVELWRQKFDLLHSPDFIAPMRGARRHVITVHDLSFIHYPEYLTAASRHYYNGKIEASIQRADHILAVSEATKRDLMDILNVPAAKITVQLNGVSERFSPLPREASTPALRKFDLPEDFFLFVGTLEPRKNLVGLARAYRELLLDLPDAPPIVIVGRPGWHFEQLMADLRAVKIDDRLIIKSDVPDADLPALYSRAIALLAPSFYEGFGLTALEGMACGALPIVSCASSFPEIVGEVGCLVDPHDIATIAAAMKRALLDSDWREQQSRAARRRAAGFRWSDSARIAQACYDALLG